MLKWLAYLILINNLNNFFLNNLYTKTLVLFISFFCVFSKVYAAEILQISSSNVVLIGDNNRTYTVKIACTEISSDLEEKSVVWLKKQLPRHTKVNLKPKGSLDGVLVAKIIPFNSNTDITEKYVNEGLATNTC